MPLKKIFLVFAVYVVVSYGLYHYHYHSFAPVDTPHTQLRANNLPVELYIPRIDIRTTIEHVGVTSSGSMDVPRIITNVAWFMHGTIPGDVGSAVIAGHYGWKNGKPSAFDALHNMELGDVIYTTDIKGVVTMFKVREVQSVPFDSDALDVFVSTDGRSHLNLITCEGTWDASRKTYSNRLIVFTDKVENQ